MGDAWNLVAQGKVVLEFFHLCSFSALGFKAVIVYNKQQSNLAKGRIASKAYRKTEVSINVPRAGVAGVSVCSINRGHKSRPSI